MKIGKLMESSSQRYIVYDKYDICPTLLAEMGTGGGNVPMIIETICLGGEQKHQAIKTDGIVPTLTSSMGTGGGYIPIVFQISKIEGETDGNNNDRSDG